MFGNLGFKVAYRDEDRERKKWKKIVIVVDLLGELVSQLVRHDL